MRNKWMFTKAMGWEHFRQRGPHAQSQRGKCMAHQETGQLKHIRYTIDTEWQEKHW